MKNDFRGKSTGILLGRALAVCSATVLLVSCAQNGDSLLLKASSPPETTPGGPAIRYQCFFFDTPDGYQVLEKTKGAHLAGIFSAEDGARLIQKLKSRRGFELASSPTVTARTNKVGTFKQMREFIYPTEYAPPQTSPQEGSFAITPSAPMNFETRELGLAAAFKGKQRPNNLVDLEFEVERTSFLGFVNYGSPIEGNTQGAFGRKVDVVLSENRVEMPVFDVKSLASSVTLESGQYLAIGGLVADSQPAVDMAVQVRLADAAPKNLFVLIRVEAVN